MQSERIVIGRGYLARKDLVYEAVMFHDGEKCLRLATGIISTETGDTLAVVLLDRAAGGQGWREPEVCALRPEDCLPEDDGRTYREAIRQAMFYADHLPGHPPPLRGVPTQEMVAEHIKCERPAERRQDHELEPAPATPPEPDVKDEPVAGPTPEQAKLRAAFDAALYNGRRPRRGDDVLN